MNLSQILFTDMIVKACGWLTRRAQPNLRVMKLRVVEARGFELRIEDAHIS